MDKFAHTDAAYLIADSILGELTSLLLDSGVLRDQ